MAYKFGDYVVVTGVGSSKQGQKGIVLASGANNADDYFVAFADNSMNWYNTSVLAPATPDTEQPQKVKQVAMQFMYDHGKTATDMLNKTLDQNPNIKLTHLVGMGGSLVAVFEGVEAY